MAYVDFLERGIRMSHKGRFNFKGIYKEITRWARQHHYDDIVELNYQTSKGKDGMDVLIQLDIYKKVSDYAKIGMELDLSGRGIKDVKVNNKFLQEGSINVSINTYIKRDYEDTWSRKHFTRFWREFYDKFIGNSGFDIKEKEIKKDVINLKNALKDYFKTPTNKK